MMSTHKVKQRIGLKINLSRSIIVDKLDCFTQAYIECALWSTMDDDGRPMDDGRDYRDIAPDTLNLMIADCQAFQNDNAELLSEMGDDSQNGHDFWLTRERHGVGFWDRGMGEIGEKLTEKAHEYGEFHLYIGDDSKI